MNNSPAGKNTRYGGDLENPRETLCERRSVLCTTATFNAISLTLVRCLARRSSVEIQRWKLGSNVEIAERDFSWSL